MLSDTAGVPAAPEATAAGRPPGAAGVGDSAGAGVEQLMAEVLAGVLGAEEVPVEGDFFTGLGAYSLVMAWFCARIRKRDDLPTVSMTDVYRHPMIRSLATTFTDATPIPGPTPTPAPASVPASPAAPAQGEAPSG